MGKRNEFAFDEEYIREHCDLLDRNDVKQCREVAKLLAPKLNYSEDAILENLHHEDYFYEQVLRAIHNGVDSEQGKLAVENMNNWFEFIRRWDGYSYEVTCEETIDKVISESKVAPNQYKLNKALDKVLEDFSLEEIEETLSAGKCTLHEKLLKAFGEKIAVRKSLEQVESIDVSPKFH